MNRIHLGNGTVVDGSGSPPYRADVLVEGNRIEAVGAVPCPEDALPLDCAGLIVAPGFVDAHSHSDLQVLEGRREKIVQGVTTEVVGNCGFSAFPAPANRALLHEFANGILCGEGGWGFASAADYLDRARRLSPVHVLSLLGHGSLRVAHAGMQHGALPPAQLAAMTASAERCLEEGACGISTGLMYHPGSSVPFSELRHVCRAAARYGRVYATHMRNYSEALIEAVREAVELARLSSCRLQVSHLQAVGKKNWPKQVAALALMEEAAVQGADVAFDCYPYEAGSTVLTQFLPQWPLEGGVAALLRRLTAARDRRRILKEMVEAMAHEWRDLYVAGVASAANQELVGRHIEEIAQFRSRDPEELVLDLLAEERGAVMILEFNQSEANLRQLLAHPLSIVVSDGFYVKGKAHPRLYGAFPKLLGEICRDRHWLTLPEAVRKITSAPARRFQLALRGLLRPGYYADLVVFDAATVGSPATYQEPNLPPSGIQWVIREGRIVVQPAQPSRPPALPVN